MAEINNNDSFTIIGVRKQPTQGVKKGGIVDLEAVIKSISQAQGKAENERLRVQHVYLAVGGAHLSSINNKGVVVITNRNREIIVDDG